MGSKMRRGYLLGDADFRIYVNGGGQECPPCMVITLRDGAGAIFDFAGDCRWIAAWCCVGRVAWMVDVVAKFRAEFVEPRLVLGYGQAS